MCVLCILFIFISPAVIWWPVLLAILGFKPFWLVRQRCVRVYVCATTYLTCFSQSSSEQLASFHLAFIHKGRHILPTSVSLLVLETQCILRMLTVCEQYCIILLRVIVCLFSFQMCHEKGCGVCVCGHLWKEICSFDCRLKTGVFMSLWVASSCPSLSKEGG